jgi:hypothetical protein
MQAAGINPMLAAMKGGASSPTGQMAPVTTPNLQTATAIPRTTHYNDVYHSAQQGSKVAQEIDNLRTTNLLLAENVTHEKLKQEYTKAVTGESQQNVLTSKAKEDESRQSAKTSYASEQQFLQHVKNLQNEIENRNKLTGSTVGLQALQGLREIASASEIKQRESLTKEFTTIQQKSQQEKTNEEAKHKTWYGRNILPYLPSMGSVMNSANTAAQIIKH